jgi:hypothetical protein
VLPTLRRPRRATLRSWFGQLAASSPSPVASAPAGDFHRRAFRRHPIIAVRRTRRRLPPIAKSGGLLSRGGGRASPGRRLLVRCAHGSCRRTVVTSSHTSFNSRHEVRGHHGCHRLLAAAWLTAERHLTSIQTQPFAFRVLRTSLEAVAHASVRRAATVGSIIRRPSLIWRLVGTLFSSPIASRARR